jgi:hypothetical protein
MSSEIENRAGSINDQYDNCHREREKTCIDQAKAATQFGPELNEKQFHNLVTEEQRTVGIGQY